MSNNIPGWSHTLNNPMKSRGLPGIDYDRTDLYIPVFFGAPREYASDEGWQTVRRRKGRRGGPAFRMQPNAPAHKSSPSE